MKENYYFAAMSIINGSRLNVGDDLPQIEVISESGEKYSGFQTNEVPTYFYMEKLAKKGHLFDHMEFFVTRECMEKRFKIEKQEKTTCEYLRDRFVQEINRLREKYGSIDEIICKKYEGETENYLDRVLNYRLIENTSDNGDLYNKLSEALNINLADACVYMDMTGGSRLSQIVSLLLMRIMENLGAKVEMIIYVDITQGAKIIDATDNYRICRLIELKDNEVNFAKEAEKIGIAKNIDLEEIQLVASLKADVSNSIKSVGEQNIKKLDVIDNKTSGNSLIERKKEHSVRQIKETVNIKNPFTRLNKLDDEKLIVSFYEEGVYAFYEVGLIRDRENGRSFRKNLNNSQLQKQQREVKELIQQMLFYYNMDNRGNKVKGQPYFHSVIGECQRIIHLLSEHTEISPLPLWESRCDVGDDFYKNYRNRYGMFYGTELNEKLLEEYQHCHGQINTCDNSFLKMWGHYQIVYANYGFPFQFVCKNVFYAEIRKYYIDKVSELMKEIDGQKKRLENEDYIEKLKEMANTLTERIPLRVDCNKLRIDESILNEQGLEKNGFMKILAERMERVRPYRNDIAHKLQIYSTEQKKELSSEIRQWVKEYETLFFEM